MKICLAALLLISYIPAFAKGKIIAEVDGFVITEEAFSLYTTNLYKDSAFVLGSKTMKEKALASMIDELLIFRRAENLGLTKDKSNKETMKVLSAIGQVQLLSNKIVEKNVTRLNETKDSFPNKIVGYFDAIFPNKSDANKFLNIATKNIEQIKDIHEKRRFFIESYNSTNPKDFLTSNKYVSDNETLTPLKERVLVSKEDGLIKDVIKSDFGYHVILIYGVHNREAINYKFYSKIYKEKSKHIISKEINLQRNSSKIEISKKNLNDLNIVKTNLKYDE